MLRTLLKYRRPASRRSSREGADVDAEVEAAAWSAPGAMPAASRRSLDMTIEGVTKRQVCKAFRATRSEVVKAACAQAPFETERA